MKKFEIRHELQASLRHPLRVRGIFAPLRTRRQSMAVTGRLEKMPGISGVKTNHLTGSIVFYADSAAQKQAAISWLENEFAPQKGISAEEVEKFLTGAKPSGAFFGVARFFFLRPFLPTGWQIIAGISFALPFIYKGWKSLVRGRFDVNTLDASALVFAIINHDFRTVSLITMLLTVADALESWTRHTSLLSLSESLALNTDTAWLLQPDGIEINVPLAQVAPGDLIVIKSGASIPVDGVVESGFALVNQSAMTGEPLPVERGHGGAVYAGTTVEAGSILIKALKVGEGVRLNQVITFIKQSEAQKSALETSYLKLADKAVPLTFAIAAALFLFTGSLRRATAALTVDYSCALKLAAPLAAYTAMRAGANQGIAIRGGKYLEALKDADTIVFDKTGTLTSAMPVLTAVIPAPGYQREEILKIMACLEEHFPHPVSRAIVEQAIKESLNHEEEHTEIEYVVAHGIKSTIHGKKMCFGSYHYLNKDLGIDLSIFADDIKRESNLGHSLLYLAIDGKAAGMAVIEDLIRPEAAETIRKLRDLGFKRMIMLTGDDERTARAVAHAVGITEFHAHALPSDKGKVIQKLNAEGCHVMMVGDGINDGPALSAASVGWLWETVQIWHGLSQMSCLSNPA